MGKEILLTALDKIKSLSRWQGGREGSFTSKNINIKGSYQEIHVSQRHTPVSFLLWKGLKLLNELVWSMPTQKDQENNECRNNKSSRTEATSSSLRIPDCPQVSKSSSAWDQKFSSCSTSALSGAPVKLLWKTVWVKNLLDIFFLSPESLSPSSHTQNRDSFWVWLSSHCGFQVKPAPVEGRFRKLKVSQRPEGPRSY